MSLDPAETILELLAAVPAGKSISPEEAARAMDGEADAWRRRLPQIRSAAVGLARQGKLVITRHGKPADPDNFKGVYRLRLPE